MSGSLSPLASTMAQECVPSGAKRELGSAEYGPRESKIPENADPRALRFSVSDGLRGRRGRVRRSVGEVVGVRHVGGYGNRPALRCRASAPGENNAESGDGGGCSGAPHELYDLLLIQISMSAVTAVVPASSTSVHATVTNCPPLSRVIVEKSGHCAAAVTVRPPVDFAG